MLVIHYHTADAFLARARTDLERNEAENNLMIGIATRLHEFPERIKTPPYLATVEEDDRLIAAAVMTPPYGVVLYAINDDPEPLRLLAEDLDAGKWHPSGVNTLSATSRAFAEIWSAKTGRKVLPGKKLRIYELHEVTPPDPPVPGRLRVATEGDLALLSGWSWGFIQDGGLEGTLDDAWVIAETRIGDRDLFVWEDERPVSMAAKTRHTTHGIVISMVYTPPALRRAGYATACVASLSQWLLDAGWKFCALFTDLANPTSNSIYRKIGYRPMVDFDEYIFE